MADEAKAASDKKVNLVSQEGDAYEVSACVLAASSWVVVMGWGCGMRALLSLFPPAVGVHAHQNIHNTHQ